MDREKFESLVREALDALPDAFLERLDTVDIIVEDEPSPDQLSQAKISNNRTILGLYEGVPLPLRYGGFSSLPDKITIFQAPIEQQCRSEKEIRDTVTGVVLHEVAHYFGIDDVKLAQIEKDRRKKPPLQ